MKNNILILGDTHISRFKDLPKKLVELIHNANWVIHTGDYTSRSVVESFIQAKKENFIGVYGNADPLNVREILPPKTILTISGIQIGIIHPYFGGSETLLMRKIRKEFRGFNVNIVIFGHTHDPMIQYHNQVLFINPGKGYLDKNSTNPSASVVIITIDKEIFAKIKNINF